MRRPSAYAPLSVTFATGKTGAALQDKYGLEGIGAWAAMIAAAKKGHGQIVFAHGEDWPAIGVLRKPAGFTLTEFLKTTGKMKQTRTKTHGHVLYVQLTRYGDWNDDGQRGFDRERKARYSEEMDRNKTGRLAEWNRSQTASEAEEAEENLDKGSTAEAALLNGDPDGYTPTGLPFQNEILYTRLLAYIGSHGDDNTPAVVRSYANRASEGQLAKVLESAGQSHARNRAKYVVGALRDEVGRPSQSALSGEEEPDTYPDEPDTG